MRSVYLLQPRKIPCIHDALPVMPESGATACAFERCRCQGKLDRAKAEIWFFDERDLGREKRFFRKGDTDASIPGSLLQSYEP
jgi:hypothetical protein